jgi:hypothetical protein
MPEQPQWSERTLDMPPQDPWADPPTAQVPPGHPASPHPSSDQPGARPASPYPSSDQPGARPASPYPPAGSPRPQSAPPAGPGPQSFQPEPSPFTRGRAQVNPSPRTPHHTAGHEPTGVGWPGAEPPAPSRSFGWHLRELRRGGEWSSAAVLFAFVCWGIWAISTDGDLTTPVIVFILSLIVAGGLFALARMVGQVVLEKHLGRVRRTARGAHMLAALFLTGVGIAHLRQTEWVMDGYRWVVGLF